jgi:phosphonate transport system substrate-binding protein
VVHPLRLTTWLAPSLPLALFEALGAAISRHTGRPVALASETLESGPRPGVHDPFRRGEVDVGFLCSPSWAWLASGPSPSVVAVPAAPVPLDPRAEGRPVYFSEVVVPAAGPASSLADLAGARWGYNDTCSLSGWFAMQARVRDPEAFFGEVVRTGSHLASLRELAEGRIEGAAIDSTVLGWALPADPVLASRVRVIESWGPYPIQPVVARADLGPPAILAIAEALLSLAPGSTAARALAPFGLAGFVASAPLSVAEIRVAATV